MASNSVVMCANTNVTFGSERKLATAGQSIGKILPFLSHREGVFGSRLAASNPNTVRCYQSVTCKRVTDVTVMCSELGSTVVTCSYAKCWCYMVRTRRGRLEWALPVVWRLRHESAIRPSIRHRATRDGLTAASINRTSNLRENTDVKDDRNYFMANVARLRNDLISSKILPTTEFSRRSS